MWIIRYIHLNRLVHRLKINLFTPYRKQDCIISYLVFKFTEQQFKLFNLSLQ